MKKNKSREKSGSMRTIILLVCFVFSYALLYALSLFNLLSNIPILNLLFPFGTWDSPMYWLMPIAGFWFVYLGISWFNNEFE